jgi:hypothetical protein
MGSIVIARWKSMIVIIFLVGMNHSFDGDIRTDADNRFGLTNGMDRRRCET